MVPLEGKSSENLCCQLFGQKIVFELIGNKVCKVRGLNTRHKIYGSGEIIYSEPKFCTDGCNCLRSIISQNL